MDLREAIKNLINKPLNVDASLAKASATYPVQRPQGSELYDMNNPVLGVLRLLGLTGEGNKDDAVVNAYNRIQSVPNQQDQDLLKKTALESYIGMAGNMSGGIKQITPAEKELLAIRQAVERMPMKEVIKGSTARLTPTKEEFEKMTQKQRQAMAELRARIYGQNTANWSN